MPRPTPTEYKDSARSKAQNIGWKWLSAKQKAVLQDESEELQGNEGALTESINAARKGSLSGPAAICSFCGKSADIMVTGAGVNICDGCIERAAALVAERKASHPPASV